jgi:AcrR family transcriptional regulator
VGDVNDRRTRKKAQTREQIRLVAQALFAERGFDAVTITDVANDADVAAQTVFNHFATKEELFFDGRGPHVDGPADAVRSRAASTPPLTALRDFLVDLTRSRLSAMADDDGDRYLVTLLGSDSLQAYERELLIEAERRLATALSEAWSGSDPSQLPVPASPGTAAALIAAMWCSAVRVLTHSQRQRPTGDAYVEELAAAAERFAAELLTQMEASGPTPTAHTAPGFPTRDAAGHPGRPAGVLKVG